MLPAAAAGSSAATIADNTATPSPPFSITAAELSRFNPPMPTNRFYSFAYLTYPSFIKSAQIQIKKPFQPGKRLYKQ
jgi:hypothetical protein